MFLKYIFILFSFYNFNSYISVIILVKYFRVLDLGIGVSEIF